MSLRKRRHSKRRRLYDLAVIELEQVTVKYGSTQAVRDVSLAVKRGSFVAMLGASGCGKTTLLKTMNGLVRPTAGRVRVDGRDTQDVPGHDLRRGVGYVFQGIGLFPHLTLAENVAVVPRLLKWSAKKTRERVEELLDLVHLPAETYGSRYPAELSGGQRQRVGVARALAARPEVMLMDEPFGALDPMTRDGLQREVRGLHDRLGLTTVLVTHDMSEALELADRVVVIRAGTVVQDGTPRELLLSPANGYVEALMNKPREQAERIEALLQAPAASGAGVGRGVAS